MLWARSHSQTKQIRSPLYSIFCVICTSDNDNDNLSRNSRKCICSNIMQVQKDSS